MASQVNAFLDMLDRHLKEKNMVTDLLDVAEKKTGVKKLYLAAGGVGVITLWLIFGYAAQLLCNSIGFIYPAYASIKAIESHRKDDDTQWLMYWVVFSMFSILEFFSDIFLDWFPLYWLAKCIFLIWCFLPISGNGATTIYSKIVKPYFDKHHGSVDNLLNKAGAAVKSAAEKAADAVKKD